MKHKDKSLTVLMFKIFYCSYGSEMTSAFFSHAVRKSQSLIKHLPCKECLMGVRAVLTELLFQLVSHLKKKLNWPRKSVTMTSCPWRRRTRVWDNFSKCFSSASTNEPETRAAVTPQTIKTFSAQWMEIHSIKYWILQLTFHHFCSWFSFNSYFAFIRDTRNMCQEDALYLW